ncbi:MAG: hypothetical protein HYX55_07975 [Chloroflexi bacterium]|nr:hypothetical protein [Chloroflexota bacterium]
MIRPVAIVALVAALVGQASAVAAHSTDPLLGSTPWGQNQLVPYMWTANQVPPSWAASNIDLGAADSEASRASRAALFSRASSAASRIAYGGSNPCPSYGIACMNRTGVPVSFGMWFKAHGAVLDWGTLRWCQAQSVATNGCYDIRRVALDEFGHVEMLNHHENYADESDYLDAVVQYAGRSRPKDGWNAHVYGRCDVARLQLEYELLDSGDPVSTCLSLATSLTIAADPASIVAGAYTQITGELEIAVATAAKRLSGDPLSRRAITLQRRDLGSTTWVVVGTMGWVTGSAGSYVISVRPAASADYRLVYDASTSEGLRDATSAVVRVAVGIGTCSAKASKGAITRPVACL